MGIIFITVFAMAYVTWRYLNHLKWNSFQCLEIDFCLAQKTEPKA